MSTTRIDLDDGKYSVLHENGAGLRAYRYGEPWRELAGDNLVFAMANKIEEAEKKALTPAEQSFLLGLLKHEREDIFFKVQSLKVAGRAFAQLPEQEAAGLVDGLISKLQQP